MTLESRRARRGLAAVLVTILVLALGCSTGTEPASKDKSKEGPIQVGAIMYARDLEYWRLIEAGMRAAAKKHDVEINIDVSNRQLATEAQLIDTLHARGDNVLVVDPLDSKASLPMLKKARNRGMTIVQYDNRVDDTSFEHFVGVDNATLGRAVGKDAKEHIDAEFGGKAKMALLTGDTEPNGPPRKKAFLSQVKGSKVVTTAEAVGSPEAGSKAFETVMQAHPDIDVVFAWNGAAMQGAAVAAKRMKSDVKIFGVDMSKQVADIMVAKNSPVVSVADQHAYDVGYNAVEVGVRTAKDDQDEKTTMLPPVVYSSDDPKGVESFLTELRKASK